MKKLKLKNKNPIRIWIDMGNKIYEGWKVTKPPRKNFWGNWICKLEKPEDK